MLHAVHERRRMWAMPVLALANSSSAFEAAQVKGFWLWLHSLQSCAQCKREDNMMDTVPVELYEYLASVDAKKKVRDQSYLCKAAAPFMVTLPPLGALRCVRPCAACASGGRH